MNIIRKRLAELNPAAYNPRRDLKPEDREFQKLRSSMDAFGCVEPLVWNEKTGNLVGGHQRYKVLVEAGETEADVSVVSLSIKEEKKLNILLNRAKGRWHDEKLAELLKELNELDALDLTGFEDYEMQGLLEQYDKLEELLAFDPEEPAEENEEPEAPETFEMSFQLPADQQEAVDRWMKQNEGGEDILSATVIEFVRGS